MLATSMNTELLSHRLSVQTTTAKSGRGNSLSNGRRKEPSRLPVQKELLGLAVEKTTRSLPTHLKYHLTSLMELAHGPPHSPLPTATITSLSLYPATGDTGSPWGQGGTSSVSQNE